MCMIEKRSIEQANPFLGIGQVTNTTDDILSFKSKVVFRSGDGAIVELKSDDTSLLYTSESEDHGEFRIGDEIDILYEENGIAVKDNGKLELYKKVLTKAKDDQVFNAEVVSSTEQGLLMSIDGLQCFMPEGQIGIEKMDDFQSLVGSTIEVKLISVKLKEMEGNRFLPIVSHKVFEDEKNVIEAQDKLQGINIGSIIQGTVKSIASYGVFVTLFPSVDGLIHIKDLSWERVSDPSEILSVGQNVNVVILDIKQTKDGKTRISLGLKQLSIKPWERFDKNTKEGDVVSGSVCSIKDYGIFIMLPSGVQGLVHKTELSWNYKVTSKDFQKGQFVTAKIINIDWEKEKLLLSIKQMLADPWENIEDKISVGDIVETTISNFTNFGIFVTIVDGIEGLIHVSELSWTEKIKKPKDHYILGDHLNAVIISIDKNKKMIELSHKQILPNPWLKYTVGQHVNAIILGVEKDGAQAKLEDDNLPAFIPAKFFSKDYVLEESCKMKCLIQEIDENKKRITLEIV